MYNDYYAQQIFNWLISNEIANKINNISEFCTKILPYIHYTVYAIVFFGLLFFALKFVRFRGLTL